MIVKNGSDPIIEERKRRRGLHGDVYLYSEHFMESLRSHKKLLRSLGYTSEATTIEEALVERERVENELEEMRRAEAEKAAQEAQKAEENANEEV